VDAPLQPRLQKAEPRRVELEERSQDPPCNYDNGDFPPQFSHGDLISGMKEPL